MSLNEGKHEKEYYTFLERKYRIDMIPCGISIPFSIELDKINKSILDIVYIQDPKTPSNKIYSVLNEYYTKNPEKAQEHMLQMIKAVSIITEFFTDGEIDESYIKKHASEDEVAMFFNKLQDIQYGIEIKKLKKMKKNLLLMK